MANAACTFYEENIKYLKEFLGEGYVETYFRISEMKLEDRLKLNPDEFEDYERVEKCLKQMEQAGENRWWLSEDKRVLAYYQLSNNMFLISMEKFLEALEILIGVHISIHSLGLYYNQIKKEAEKAFNRFQKSS